MKFAQNDFKNRVQPGDALSALNFLNDHIKKHCEKRKMLKEVNQKLKASLECSLILKEDHVSLSSSTETDYDTKIIKEV